MLDPDTAADLVDAFRLLEGRLRPFGRHLSRGAEELRRVAEGSLRSPTGGLSPNPSESSHDRVVDPYLLTLEEVGDRLNVGLSTVKAEIKRGALRSVHIGRAHRVHSDDLAQYMSELRDADAA